MATPSAPESEPESESESGSESAERYAQNRAAGRFEVSVEGVLAGICEYQDDRSVRTFPHTVVERQFGGRGLGGRLVRYALDQTHSDGLSAVGSCSFVARVLDTDPEYADLRP